MKNLANVLSEQEKASLLSILEERFRANTPRHPVLSWQQIAAKLEKNPQKLWSLAEMERTGGEPDVIGCDESTGEYLFCDCAPETPVGRRSLCFDRQAWESRKANKPESSAKEMADSMGITLLTEAQYRNLQTLGAFDTKTSSWVETPSSVRSLGGALFCDRRYNQVFLYHNGAESYYAGRGFRGMLLV